MSKNKDSAVNFLMAAARGEAQDAFTRYAKPDGRHHNPYFAADFEALAAGMDANAKQFPQKKLIVERAVEEGDVVVVHSRVRHAPDQGEFALVHIFRFEDGRIAELWDVAMAVPSETVNDLGMF